MTLIAAYRPEGIPVLVGDFLITSGEKQSSRKKIHKISPNFVIGWTGKRILAAPILKALFEEFGDKIVTIQQVEEFLTNRPADELIGEKLHLVGWVIDDNPHCFLWNIAYPTVLFYEPYHIAGTGEKKFKELITRKSLGRSWGDRRTNIEQAIYSALAKAAELYSDEVLERMNRRRGFGYAYELLYFDGSEFRYLNNVAFLGVDIILNPVDWTTRAQFYSTWYRYHSLGDASFLQVSDLRNGSIKLETISPAFTQKLRDAAFEFVAGSFRADYYCIYFRMQTTQNEFYQGSLVLVEKADAPSLYAKQNADGYSFELSSELIKGLYEHIKVERQHSENHSIKSGWGAAETANRITKANSRVEFQTGQADKCAVFGLMTDSEWDHNYDTVDYAIMFCADATIQIYEKGIAVGPCGKPYSAEDTFSLSVVETSTGLVVEYRQNGFLIHASPLTIELPLKGALCLREDGAIMKPARFLTL